MKELDDILRGATAEVGSSYIELPIHGAPAVYRERVYCYELYHQMRKRWPPKAAFTLNGEVDKRAHPILEELAAAGKIPDLLVHTPGNMKGNHAIIEVKAGPKPSRSGIRKDLETLTKFQSDVGYKRSIYLFYNGYPAEVLRDEADFVRTWLGKSAQIEIWVHQTAGSPAEMVESIEI